MLLRTDFYGPEANHRPGAGHSRLPNRRGSGTVPPGLARHPGPDPWRPLARAADPDHGLDHLLVVLQPGKIRNRPARPPGALAGPGAPTRHGTALLVRDVCGPGHRHHYCPGAALLLRLFCALPRAPGH